MAGRAVPDVSARANAKLTPTGKHGVYAKSLDGTKLINIP